MRMPGRRPAQTCEIGPYPTPSAVWITGQFLVLRGRRGRFIAPVEQPVGGVRGHAQ